MKKKLLFVIDSLSMGGAEKSLVSLLNLLDFTKYEVDLLFFKQGCDLEKFIPESVNILPIPDYFSFLSGVKFSNGKNLRFIVRRILTSLNLRVNKIKSNSLNSEQVVFRSIKKHLKPIEQEYDVAIAYSQGMPTYFVANKVIASKKFAWINNDYINTTFNKKIDNESYKSIDKIIAVSEYIKKSVAQISTDYKNKVDIIFDIIDPKVIYQKAKEKKVFDDYTNKVKILTVGRLVPEKSYDLAIKVAKLLKNNGYNFKWFVVGEGSERSKLQDLINQYGLSDYFILLGKKINPYVYMGNCDIYVQTSIREGFGLTVCEAKILKKPIVCTNFSTAKEIIRNNVDGLIVENTVESIYNGITKYIDDTKFKQKILFELENEKPYSSVDQIEKFYKLVENG